LTLLQERVKFHVLLTTYEMVSKHLADIRRLEWAALVVDEAHRLKNANSRLFQVRGCAAQGSIGTVDLLRAYVFVCASDACCIPRVLCALQTVKNCDSHGVWLTSLNIPDSRHGC
jgi:hypothetical protein